VKYAANAPGRFNLYENIACSVELKNGESYEIYAADSNGGVINSLQTTAKTVAIDAVPPTLDPIKYYTDSSRTSVATSDKWYNKPITAVAFCLDTPTNESSACSCAPYVHSTTTDPIEWLK